MKNGAKTISETLLLSNKDLTVRVLENNSLLWNDKQQVNPDQLRQDIFPNAIKLRSSS